MTHKFRVTVVESERGWGQKYETVDFDSFSEAKAYRDYINSYNKPLGPGESVPDWYMFAENEIRVIEK